MIQLFQITDSGTKINIVITRIVPATTFNVGELEIGWTIFDPRFGHDLILYFLYISKKRYYLEMQNVLALGDIMYNEMSLFFPFCRPSVCVYINFCCSYGTDHVSLLKYSYIFRMSSKWGLENTTLRNFSGASRKEQQYFK